MSIEAMKQAVEALALFASDESDDGQIAIAAHEALEQAIEQAEEHEWAGLTDEEIAFEWRIASHATPKTPWWSSHIRLARAVEAKLKEKNAYGWQSVANPTEYLDDLRGGADE